MPEQSKNPSRRTGTIFLFGAGYVLERLALSPLPRQAVLVRRSPKPFSPEVVGGAEVRPLTVEALDAEDLPALHRLFENYEPPFTVIDSIPPRDGTITRANSNIVEVASRWNVQQAIYLSSTSVYDGRDGVWVDEETPCDPHSIRGRARIEAEGFYSRAAFPAVSLRLSGIYGPGRGIGVRLKQGTYRLTNPNRFTNRIHVDDIVAIMQRILSGEHRLEKYEVFNVSDDCPAPIVDVVEHYVKVLGLQAPPPEGESLISSSGREEQSQRVSNAKLKRVLAPLSLKYPTYREGAGSEL